MIDNELADKLRARADRVLAERLAHLETLSPAALVRILYPVICKYRSIGMSLADIASTLHAEGYSINKGHLVRHLGAIEKERQAVSLPAAQDEAQQEQEQKPDTAATLARIMAKAKARASEAAPSAPPEASTAPEQQPPPAPTKPKPAPAVAVAPARPSEQKSNGLDYTPDHPLELEGAWITGATIRWWDWPDSHEGGSEVWDCPLPMPARYALPEDMHPAQMPPVTPSDEWSIYRLKPMAEDKRRLPDTGSPVRPWWCYFAPRMGSLRKLYGVLPGIDPEAPYGRYPDGRPYDAKGNVWGAGLGGAVRQMNMIERVPPMEKTPVDLFLGMPDLETSSVWTEIESNPQSPYVLEWKKAAQRCGLPTDLPPAERC